MRNGNYAHEQRFLHANKMSDSNKANLTRSLHIIQVAPTTGIIIFFFMWKNK